MKVRILVFGITENPGGIESVIMNYYREIDRTLLQFDFLCNTEEVAYEEEIKKMGGTIYKITSRSKNATQYYKELNQFFKENSNKYNTIWVNVCSLANIDYLKYAKKYGIKYRIIHCHNSQNMDSKARKILHILNRNRLEKYATDYWTCSNNASKWFYNKKILKKHSVVYIKNAIDFQKFKFDDNIRNKYRKDFNVEGKLVLGNIGRFHFQKNQLFVLDVFKIIHEKEKNSVLLLIGDGEDRNKIEEKINQLELNESVKLLGVRDDVEKIMQAMDILLFPSLFEGLPLVLIEAQANGLKIFASDSISKEVQIGKNIVFMSLNDKPEKWADSILVSDVKRIDNYDLIKLKGYDIKTEKEKVQKLLMRI